METATQIKFKVTDSVVLELNCLYHEAADQIRLIKDQKTKGSLKRVEILRVHVGGMTFQSFKDIYGHDLLKEHFEVHMGWDPKTHDYLIDYSNKLNYREGNRCR